MYVHSHFIRVTEPQLPSPYWEFPSPPSDSCRGSDFLLRLSGPDCHFLTSVTSAYRLPIIAQWLSVPISKATSDMLFLSSRRKDEARSAGWTRPAEPEAKELTKCGGAAAAATACLAGSGLGSDRGLNLLYGLPEINLGKRVDTQCQRQVRRQRDRGLSPATGRRCQMQEGQN